MAEKKTSLYIMGPVFLYYHDGILVVLFPTQPFTIKTLIWTTPSICALPILCAYSTDAIQHLQK
jgi:hypothetical protein